LNSVDGIGAGRKCSIIAEKQKYFSIVRVVDDLVNNLRTKQAQLIELAIGCPIWQAIWHQKLKPGRGEVAEGCAPNL